MEGSEALNLPDEALEQTIPEEALEPVVETPEETGEQSQQAETPKKVLGLFNDEQEAVNTLRDLTNRLQYYEQNEKHQQLRQQEEQRQHQLSKQEEQRLREAAYVHDMANSLFAQGRGPEAINLIAEYTKKHTLSEVDALVEAKFRAAQEPYSIKQDYLASKLGQMMPELADEAVALVRQGWQKEDVARMFTKLRGDDRQQRARDAKNRALRDGFIEPPDGGSLATAPSNDNFDKLLKKHTKSFFDE